MILNIHICLDSAETNLEAVMNQVIPFLSKVERIDGRALVHCVSGTYIKPAVQKYKSRCKLMF